MTDLKSITMTCSLKPGEARTDTRPLNFGLFRRLFSYARPYAAKRNALFVMVILRSIQLPALAWTAGAIINGPIAHGDLRGLAWGIAGFLGLALSTQITMHFRHRLALELGEAVVHDLRRDLFRHLMHQTMSFYSRVRLGSIISRFTSDAEAVRIGVQSVLFVSLVNLGTMIIASVLMCWYSPILFAILLAMLPVLWLMNRRFRTRLSVAYRQVQESLSRVTATVTESVRGVRVTQSFVRQNVNAGLFRDLVIDHSGYNLRVAEAESVFLPMMELNGQFFLAVLILVGGYRVVNADAGVDLGGLIQFILLSGNVFGPIQSLSNMYSQALVSMAGAERVFKFLDMPPDWTDAPDAVAPDALRGRVEFEAVSFAYKPGRPILRNISFTAEPGQTIALVGHTGSGKTTMINLIAKFYLPGEGRILVDGRDIRELSGAALRRQLGIVLQQNFLFTGTVLENIRFGRPEAGEAEALDAVRRLDCLDLLAGLPDGLATRVGEEGTSLSAGQRQLICFARAMLADPRILILDEATSAVDALTEARLRKALFKLLAGRTNFIVAHRLSTIRQANLVLVMDGGRIIERGTHRHLLKLNGIYANLHHQFMLAHQI
ncbi:MAG: ABC transporter ATP-binding protein/permease [Kiritimatiellae bacterium]|nr:ABC transporter ATP-binding protein/permease [Kiritimatiellia bacterium]